MNLLDTPTDELLAAARARRDRVWKRRITYSPKVFLPLTNLCRNVCDYCAFRRSPKDEGAHTMSPDEVIAQLERAAQLGCTEALFCLGDRPEAVFPSYRAQLAAGASRAPSTISCGRARSRSTPASRRTPTPAS